MVQFQHISAQQAKGLLDEGAAVVDIRDPQAYQHSHIERAAYINNENLEDFIAAADLDRPLIVYCYHGNASQSAAQFLIERGFEEVYSLDGGFEAWRALHPT